MQIMGFGILTIVLTLGLSVVITYGMRSLIAANWEKNRCDPGVVMTAGIYKPADDQRTAGEFAEDNWRYCQKEYVQNAVRAAATIPKDLAAAQAATVGRVEDMVTKSGDVFYDLWKFVHQAFSTFMDSMKGAAMLFQNFIIQLHSIIDRLHASIISIVFALIATVVTFINSVQVILMVAIIVVGILLVMQILLFFLLLPISGLIISVSALVSVVVVVIGTAISAAMVAEHYTPGACFTPDTPVAMRDGSSRRLDAVHIGDELQDEGRVTAVHYFRSAEPLFEIAGIHVTGDHLVYTETGLIEARNHPKARSAPISDISRDLICLTTTTRRIPVITATIDIIYFADWEEIAEDATETLHEWYHRVWAVLNPFQPCNSPADIQSDAGLSPDCRIEVPGGLWRICAVKDLRIGDMVLDASGSPTRITGLVVMEGSMETDAIALGSQLVSPATWILHGSTWTQAAAVGARCEQHIREWLHVYTASGTVRLDGGWGIRDASEIGLQNLRPLVQELIVHSH